jgi:hypothetical protein
MLRLNLATRPFYNDRVVTAGIAVVAILTAVLTAFNIVEIVSLNNRNRELTAQAAAAEARAADLRALAAKTRQAMNQDEVSAVQVEARTANMLIDRRVFSWTDLFNRFEETLPDDVRIVAVSPQVDQQGRMLVAMTVVARSQQSRDEFIERLEETGAFWGTLPRADTVQDDGTLRSTIQGYYNPQGARTAEPASEQQQTEEQAAENANPQNATPGASAPKEPQ